MRSSLLFLLLAASFLLLPSCQASPGASLGAPSSETAAPAEAAPPRPEQQNLAELVNPLIGVLKSDGNTVVGPQRPNASANPSPDTPRGNNSGYSYNQPIRGFSQLHASGTGAGKYGQVLVSPQIGLAVGQAEHDSPKANESAKCYEYKVTLSRYNIGCAFTPAEHSVIYQFTYPASDDANVVVDIAHNIPQLIGIAKLGVSGVTLDLAFDPQSLPILSGSGKYSGGFGPGHPVYFYMTLDKAPITSGIYDVQGLHERQTSLRRTIASSAESAGAYFKYDTSEGEVVSLKVGVSFKSVEQAKAWLAEEIPGWDYNAVKNQTIALWNDELNKIIIDADSAEQKQIFYTALYHSLVMPRDRTGDLAGYPAGAPMIDDHYAGWDTWRTLYPLLNLIKPDLVRQTVNSFIARYEKNGYVRDTFIGGSDMAEQQGGDDADNIICDAFVKGLDGVDWSKAYAVVKNNADHFRQGFTGWGQPLRPASSPVPYVKYGYIPAGKMSCSDTLEYSYNDFCASQMAAALGTPEDAARYLARSKSWENLWNPDLKSGTYSGFIAPKDSSGNFIAIDPRKNFGSWNDYFYEGSSWTYSYFVPHDPGRLVELSGGAEAFAAKLKYGFDNGLIDYSNEPAFLSVYMFNYTDKPYLTSQYVNKVRKSFTVQGMPGNDDSGAMSSWYVFSSLGFFPNAGQNLYYITSPRCKEADIWLENGKEIKILAPAASDLNQYIQSVKLNGEPYYKTTLTHDDIKNGALLEFEMGSAQTDYTKIEN